MNAVKIEGFNLSVLELSFVLTFMWDVKRANLFN